MELDAQSVWRIDRTGGTLLYTSRIHPGHLKKKEIPPFLRNSPELIGSGSHERITIVALIAG